MLGTQELMETRQQQQQSKVYHSTRTTTAAQLKLLAQTNSYHYVCHKNLWKFAKTDNYTAKSYAVAEGIKN